MNSLSKAALAAGLAVAAIAAPAIVTPAAAQKVAGIAIVNLPAVVVNSNAYKTAQEQRPVTYKAQIDQANARREAISQQLQPLVTRLQTDSQQPNANQQALQQLTMQIQQIDQAGQAELQQILAPVAMSQAYVEEQINDRLEPALQSASRKQNVSLVLSPDNILHADNAYNMNQAVLDELNALIPTAQLVPPQGWLPRELRDQQAAAQAAQAAQAARPAAPAQTATSGR